MNRLFLILILAVTLSCISEKKQDFDVLAKLEVKKVSAISSEEKAIEHPHTYEVKLAMHNLPNNRYDFEVEFLIEKDSYFVSPNSIPDAKGKFKIHLEENSKLELVSDLIETPPSKEEIDPFTFENVRLVRQDTKYNQGLKPLSSEDFQVRGHLHFVIEPQCTLEKIPLIFKYEDGELRVELFGC